MKKILGILVLLFVVGFSTQEAKAQSLSGDEIEIVNEVINYNPAMDLTLAYDQEEDVYYSKYNLLILPTDSPTSLSGEQLDEVCCKTCGPCESTGWKVCTDSTDNFWSEPCRYTPPRKEE